MDEGCVCVCLEGVTVSPDKFYFGRGNSSEISPVLLLFYISQREKEAVKRKVYQLNDSR